MRASRLRTTTTIAVRTATVERSAIATARVSRETRTA